MSPSVDQGEVSDAPRDAPRVNKAAPLHTKSFTKRSDSVRSPDGKRLVRVDSLIEAGLSLQDAIYPAFASRLVDDTSVLSEANRFPSRALPAKVAAQVIQDELMLNHNPRLNLASFCTTWMEPEAHEIIMSSLNINQVDMDEYPASTEIHNRCVNMMADLYNAPERDPGTGTATCGSSEAVMLAGLAFKMRWQQARRARGLDTDRPNLVMGSNAQICWEKFARYFEVEPRLVPVSEQSGLVLSPDAVKDYVDERTIGVVAILGSTYNGAYEDIAGISRALDKLAEEGGPDVEIHVDAASGGFVAPFVHADLPWDFRVPRVASINVSGHKYGLVYPGVGWVMWRDAAHLPDSLVFHTHYLGSDQPSVTLNFSKPSWPILAQYYQLMRLGRSGFKRIMGNLMNVREYLANRLLATGFFVQRHQDLGVPLVAFSLSPKEDGTKRGYDEFDLAEKLLAYRWVVPAYKAPKGAEEIVMFRAVIREDLTLRMADKLATDIERAVHVLEATVAKGRAAVTTAVPELSPIANRMLVKQTTFKGVC